MFAIPKLGTPQMMEQPIQVGELPTSSVRSSVTQQNEVERNPPISKTPSAECSSGGGMRRTRPNHPQCRWMVFRVFGIPSCISTVSPLVVVAVLIRMRNDVQSCRHRFRSENSSVSIIRNPNVRNPRLIPCRYSVTNSATACGVASRSEAQSEARGARRSRRSPAQRRQPFQQAELRTQSVHNPLEPLGRNVRIHRRPCEVFGMR